MPRTPSAFPFSGRLRRRAINPTPPKRVKAWGEGPLRPEVMYPVVEHTRPNRAARNHSRSRAPHHRTQKSFARSVPLANYKMTSYKNLTKKSNKYLTCDIIFRPFLANHGCEMQHLLGLDTPRLAVFTGIRIRSCVFWLRSVEAIWHGFQEACIHVMRAQTGAPRPSGSRPQGSNPPQRG